MTPSESVVTLATYLEVDDVLSQPHGFVPEGKEEEVCTASVIEVRQAEAANMTSETFAFFV